MLKCSSLERTARMFKFAVEEEVINTGPHRSGIATRVLKFIHKVFTIFRQSNQTEPIRISETNRIANIRNYKVYTHRFMLLLRSFPRRCRRARCDVVLITLTKWPMDGVTPAQCCDFTTSELAFCVSVGGDVPLITAPLSLSIRRMCRRM